VLDFISKNNLKVKWILETHAHAGNFRISSWNLMHIRRSFVRRCLFEEGPAQCPKNRNRKLHSQSSTDICADLWPQGNCHRYLIHNKTY
jgi:hypothetical protein